ncbi:glycerol kinase GlpK [Halomonas salinarum]|uniref:glycerol kinase GlpK n=1 Tax=Halomonas salinarum TaxID=1158993 RepID=UPI0014388884|nr:glycerol kinase GlpK [Halomonas salinarum]
MNKGYILAIDQGTTGSTVLVFDHDGTARGKAYREFQQYYPKPGWVEHDAEMIWNVTHQVVSEALTHADILPDQIVGIGITNQRETTVLWDRETGEPVHRAIVWQDRRAAGICETLREEGLEATFRDKTGLVCDPYFSGTKVRWLLDNVSGLRERAERGELAFGTIDSWLVYKLTGGRVHATDVSNASRTLMYNIHTLEWDEALLDLLKVPAVLLPEVKASSSLFGETDPDAFFGARVPVAGIAGDQQAALFGEACHGEGMAKNTYGTGSFLLMNTGTQPVASQHGLLTTIAWRIGDEPVEYALEGAIFVTGAAVQWLRDELGIIEDAADTERMALSLSGNDNVYFVPALTGLGAPYWDPYARGTLLGVTRGTTKAHIARAVLESIAYQARDIVEVMVDESGIPLRELRADGGGAVNTFLMQFQADVLGVPVKVPRITETTALGAAYLAGLATGFWKDRAEIDAKWQLAQRYQPAMPEAERAALYQRWHRAVALSRAWDSPLE